jgi:hypothetical protein
LIRTMKHLVRSLLKVLIFQAHENPSIRYARSSGSEVVSRIDS